MANFGTNEVSLGENSSIIIATRNSGSPTASLGVVQGTIIETAGEKAFSANESRGYKFRGADEYDCIIEVQMFWIPNQNPIGNPPNLFPGQKIYSNPTYSGGKPAASPGSYPALQIWPDFENAPAASYIFPAIYIERLSITIDGRGVQVFHALIKNQGAYSSPSSTFTIIT